MENQVWEKVSIFLKELRCEDMSRDTLLHLRSCEEEKECLKEKQQVYQMVLEQLSSEQIEGIEAYLEQVQTAAFEEQQEAYCQGMVDCIQIISGLGLIEVNNQIVELVNQLK